MEIFDPYRIYFSMPCKKIGHRWAINDSDVCIKCDKHYVIQITVNEFSYKTNMCRYCMPWGPYKLHLIKEESTGLERRIKLLLEKNKILEDQVKQSNPNSQYEIDLLRKELQKSSDQIIALSETNKRLMQYRNHNQEFRNNHFAVVEKNNTLIDYVDELLQMLENIQENLNYDTELTRSAISKKIRIFIYEFKEKYERLYEEKADDDEDEDEDY